MRRGVLLVMFLTCLWPCPSRAEDWAIIVHPSRQVELDLSDVALIFLKQRRFWKDGSAIVPVNRSAGSEARESFAKAVFGSEVIGHAAYWNRQYFRGVLPPISLASDEAVLRYVASEPRSIGYTPARLVDESVRVAARFNPSPD